MSDLKKAAEMALGVLLDPKTTANEVADAIKTIRQALAQPEWVGLMDEDLKPLCDEWRIMYGGYVDDFAKAIEAKLKEKNT